MKCIKCGSEDLEIVKASVHNKLVCKDCLAFQKFLSDADAKTFEQLEGKVGTDIPCGVASSFHITTEQSSKISDWLAEHDKHCTFADPEKCEAIGGRLTYCFTGTSLGGIGKVLCACGKKFVFTDMSDW